MNSINILYVEILGKYREVKERGETEGQNLRRSVRGGKGEKLSCNIDIQKTPLVLGRGGQAR